MIVESLYTVMFSAIAPPDQIEWAPIMSVSITLSCSLIFFAVVITSLIMSPLVNYVHDLLQQTSYIRLSSVHLLLRF